MGEKKLYNLCFDRLISKRVRNAMFIAPAEICLNRLLFAANGLVLFSGGVIAGLQRQYARNPVIRLHVFDSNRVKQSRGLN